MAFVDERVGRIPTLIHEWADQGAGQGKRNVLRVDHCDLLVRSTLSACLLPWRYTIAAARFATVCGPHEAMDRIRIDMLQVMAVDLHKRVFQDLPSCHALVWLLVEELGNERSR